MAINFFKRKEKKLIEAIKEDPQTAENYLQLGKLYFLNGDYVSRIIEGCSSVSIIILFLSFIIAFSGSLKSTVLFGLFGSLLIYVVNILRIIAISILFIKFPEYQTILHDLVFPSIIYGLTFMLWVTWVKYFSKLNKDATR